GRCGLRFEAGGFRGRLCTCCCSSSAPEILRHQLVNPKAWLIRIIEETPSRILFFQTSFRNLLTIYRTERGNHEFFCAFSHQVACSLAHLLPHRRVVRHLTDIPKSVKV